MNFYNNGGGWEAQLLWSSPSTPKVAVPQSQLYSGVAPIAPSNLVVTAASGTGANISWNDNSLNETGFTLERTNPDNSLTDFTLPPNTTSYLDNSLSPGITYSYRIQATNFAANSTWTAEVPVTTPVIPPNPSNGHATAVTTTSISLAWQLNSTNSTNQETGVRISRRMRARKQIQSGNRSRLPAGSAELHRQLGSPLARTDDYHMVKLSTSPVCFQRHYRNDDRHAHVAADIARGDARGRADFARLDSPDDDPLRWNHIQRLSGHVHGRRRGDADRQRFDEPSLHRRDGNSRPALFLRGHGGGWQHGKQAPPATSISEPRTSSNVPTPGSLYRDGRRHADQFVVLSSVSAATSYKIYRGTSIGGEGVHADRLSGLTGTTFRRSEPAARPQLLYYPSHRGQRLKVEAARQREEAVGVLAPTAPTGVTAAIDNEDGDNDINVNWTAPAGATSYNIFRSHTMGGEGSTPYATGVTGTTYADPGAASTPGTSFYYTVWWRSTPAVRSSPSGEAFRRYAPFSPGHSRGLDPRGGECRVELVGGERRHQLQCLPRDDPRRRRLNPVGHRCRPELRRFRRRRWWLDRL